MYQTPLTTLSAEGSRALHGMMHFHKMAHSSSTGIGSWMLAAGKAGRTVDSSLIHVAHDAAPKQPAEPGGALADHMVRPLCMLDHLIMCCCGCGLLCRCPCFFGLMIIADLDHCHCRGLVCYGKAPAATCECVLEDLHSRASTSEGGPGSWPDGARHGMGRLQCLSAWSVLSRKDSWL